MLENSLMNTSIDAEVLELPKELSNKVNENNEIKTKNLIEGKEIKSTTFFKEIVMNFYMIFWIFKI